MPTWKVYVLECKDFLGEDKIKLDTSCLLGKAMMKLAALWLLRKALIELNVPLARSMGTR